MTQYEDQADEQLTELPRAVEQQVDQEYAVERKRKEATSGEGARIVAIGQREQR